MAMSTMTDNRDCGDDSNSNGEYSGSHVHFMDDLDQGLWNSEAGPDIRGRAAGTVVLVKVMMTLMVCRDTTRGITVSLLDIRHLNCFANPS